MYFRIRSGEEEAFLFSDFPLRPFPETTWFLQEIIMKEVNSGKFCNIRSEAPAAELVFSKDGKEACNSVRQTSQMSCLLEHVKRNGSDGNISVKI